VPQFNVRPRERGIPIVIRALGVLVQKHAEDARVFTFASAQHERKSAARVLNAAVFEAI